MLRIILEILPVLLLSYTAQVLFKQGANNIGAFTLSQLLAKPGFFLMQVIVNWRIILGFILAGIGAFFYIMALSKNDFTVIFPILGALGFIVLPIIGYIFLHEPITLQRVFGTVLIAAGMIIISSKA